MSSNWPTMELRQALSLDLHRVQLDPTGTYPMVGVYSFGRGLFHREPVSGGKTSYKYFYRLESDHIVMSQLFGWEGALALSSDKFAGRFVSPQFPTFRCDSSKLDREFLGWYMRRPLFWEELGRRTRGMGDRRRTLGPDAVLSCSISLPPLAEQRRIVARIEELAAKIDEARRLRKEVESSLRGVLLSAYNEITKGAPRRPMAEVAPLKRRPVEVEPGEKYYETGIRSFGKGTFHKPPIEGTSVGTKKLFRIEANDLLFNIVFAWEGAVAVATPRDHGRVGSHRFLTCVPKEGLATSTFLCFHFLTDQGLEQLGKASPGGAGRNRTLGLKALEELQVPLPVYEKQLWFDSLLAKVDSLRALHTQTAAELDALLPSILDRAFKGEL